MAFSLDIVLTKENHIDARTDIWLTAASSEVLLASDGCWRQSGATSHPGGTVTFSPFFRSRLLSLAGES